jgi:hypothetical protein
VRHRSGSRAARSGEGEQGQSSRRGDSCPPCGGVRPRGRGAVHPDGGRHALESRLHRPPHAIAGRHSSETPMAPSSLRETGDSGLLSPGLAGGFS